MMAVMENYVWVLCLCLFLHQIPDAWSQIAASQAVPATCAQLNMNEMRTVVTQAIENARTTLMGQKQLNEYLSRTGFDEAKTPTAHMPKTYHQHYAAFSHLNQPASVQVDSGFIVNFATKEITEKLRINADDLVLCPGVLEFWHDAISLYCKRRNAVCDPTAKYRSIDGSCNNLNNPVWGRSNRPHRRLLKPHYIDDIGLPRQTSMTGEYLPSPRTVSNVVHHQDPCCPLMESDLSLFVMQWGQMLDHDLTDTAIAKGANDANIMCCNLTQELLMRRTECFPIPIAAGDARFTEPCMNFVRSIAGHDDNCNFGRRNQLNQATSFLDGSFLYGHNEEDANEIRSYIDGSLRMTKQHLFPPGKEDLTECEVSNPGDYCMKSGDFRIHVMPGLTAMQVAFLREHNRIAGVLRKLNPTMCDEDLYQETRKIVIGEIQHITYAHWLPHVIGTTLTTQMGLAPAPMGRATVYDPSIDPTITNVFGASAFRFGHTLLQNTVMYMKNTGMHIRNEMAFNRPTMIFSDDAMGCSFVGRGLSLHPSSKADGKIVDSVRNNLFLDMDGKSFDLISLNIQRGREHGIQGYNAWRRYCGLPYAIHFGTGPGGLVHHSQEDAMKLFSVYSHPEDIDVFPGGMSEQPVDGGVIGPLFSCIVGQQFRNLKLGDRFYYENCTPGTGFTEGQINEIKKASLAKLMCLHFHMPHVQMNPFRMPSQQNPMVSCSMLPDMDLSLWQEA